MTPQSLDLSGIAKGFGAGNVLDGIDLAVRPGEFLALVGMSGCGKSTLLRIIAGLETPDAGSVAIGGRDVTGLDPAARNLAMVFQSYALYPHMTVRENIATPLRMRRLGAAARLPLLGRLVPGQSATRAEIALAVRQAADMLQIGGLLDRRPAQLSGGQRQRVALARALVREPAAFLMDEPLSNLDARLRAHMRDELATLHRRLGATFVYVTHDQIEAMTMADRIALMEGGRILQLGTPSELYDQPQSLGVARFIGTPAINLLPAEIDRTGRISVSGRPVALAARAQDAGPATLGVRPEDLRLARGTGLCARLLRIEPHGADRFLALELLDGAEARSALVAVRHGREAPEVQRLTLRQHAGAPLEAEPGEIVELAFDTDRAHLFGRDGLRRTVARRERATA